jgi:hypothetical protein
MGVGNPRGRDRAKIARVKPVFKEVKLNLFSPMAAQRGT